MSTNHIQWIGTFKTEKSGRVCFLENYRFGICIQIIFVWILYIILIHIIKFNLEEITLKIYIYTYKLFSNSEGVYPLWVIALIKSYP